MVVHDPSLTGSHSDSPCNRLQHAIDHAAHLLPAQGPITVFIHHNTLHAFEDSRSTRRSSRAADVFGCQPYLTEDRYREALGRGRIRFDDLRAVLADDLGDRGRRAIPLLRHAARPAAGDAPVPAADRADGGAALVRRRDRRPAPRPAGGVRGGPRRG